MILFVLPDRLETHLEGCASANSFLKVGDSTLCKNTIGPNI